MDILLKDTLEYYIKNKDRDFVCDPAIPILYFGNHEEYCNSDLKIITVGLNPSDKEFNKGRFNCEVGSILSVAELKNELNSYFIKTPYRTWFNSSFEPILQHFDASFYGEKYPINKTPNWWTPQKNRVLHTDLCSPLATNPTWSKLSTEQTNQLEQDGFQLWKRLVKELKPQIILVSIAKKHLEKFKNLEWEDISIQRKSERYYPLKAAKYADTLLIWGKAGVQPFAPLRKTEYGQLVCRVKEAQMTL